MARERAELEEVKAEPEKQLAEAELAKQKTHEERLQAEAAAERAATLRIMAPMTAASPMRMSMKLTVPTSPPTLLGDAGNLSQSPPLLGQHRPNKEKILKTIHHVFNDGPKKAGIRFMLSKFLGVTVDSLPQDHEEISDMLKLDTEELAEHFMITLSKQQVDSFFNECFPDVPDNCPSLIEPPSSPSTLRREAAILTGIGLDTLPDPKILERTARWLYSLLEDKDGQVTKDQILAASLEYDDRIEEGGILATLEEIGAEGSQLRFPDFYNWLVLMFGEVESEEEFIGGCTDFGDAARVVRGPRRSA